MHEPGYQLNSGLNVGLNSSLQISSDRIEVIRSFGFREDGLEPLAKYLNFLWAANKELNLFSRKMLATELIDNHLIDCLLALPHFPKSSKVVADLGSGGGLPAVIYAIQFPEIQFRLFEKSPNKRKFLSHCKGIAPNIEVFAEISKDLSGVDLVTARAFKPIDVILDLTQDYYRSGGRYFLLKGRREKIEEELGQAKRHFKQIQSQILPLHSPVMDVERHLVLI